MFLPKCQYMTITKVTPKSGADWDDLLSWFTNNVTDSFVVVGGYAGITGGVFYYQRESSDIPSQGNFTLDQQTVVIFANEDDAIQFKLRWC